MKALGIMLLLLGILAAPVIAQGTLDVSTSSTPFLIVPGQSIGPVRLGTPFRGDVVRLGPAKGTTKLDDGTTMYRWYEPPTNIGIGVLTNQNGMVLRVWVLNDARYSTKDRLHVGSSEAEVRATLGVPTRIEVSSQPKTKTLIYDALGLWFNIQLDQQLNFYNTVFDIGIMTTQAPPPAASAPRASPPPAASAPQASPPPAASVPQASPPPAASAPQVTSPPSDPSRLYMVRVGPVPDRDRAAALEKQLAAGGFSQAKVTTQTGFRVVSEPLPRSAAEGLNATLAGRGFRSQIESLAGDTVHLVFGMFTTQKEAETLAQRIGAAGYDAWVREGTVYTLQLGPYPQSSVNAIIGIVRSGIPDAVVTTDPPQSSQPAAPAPQASPPPTAPVPQASAPAASVPKTSPPPSAPAASTNERLYMVRVGPISDRDRASALEKQLSFGGFSQTKVTTAKGYLVASEPLPRSAAEGLNATLAGRGFRSQIESLAGDTVHLVFGTFTTQQEAEALAQRIVAAGYDAWVREGTVYTLQLGPYPQSSVNTINGIIKADAAVTTDPPQASPAPAAAGPPASPPPAASTPRATPPPAAPAPKPQAPPPAASAPKIPPPPPAPASISGERLYMVRVGPVSDRDRASAVAKDVVVGGFSQTKVTTQKGYRVVSKPLPRGVAEGVSATLAGRGFRSQIEPVAGDTVQLVFGTFTTQQEAETLAQRIGAAGSDASVREGITYAIWIGLYPPSSVNTIIGIIKSGAPDATVTVVPVP